MLVVASIGWSVWATHDSPITAYFSTFTRAYELGIGAACALLPLAWRPAGRAAHRPRHRGLVGIAVASFWYTPATAFPGAAALLPVLATAALVVAGEGTTTRAPGVTRLLGTSSLGRIGDWSYSLYLWHWPVIVLVRSNLGPERFSSIPVRVLTLAVVVLLSWATYRWVETPFRTGRTWRRPSRALLVYPVSVGVVLATVVASTQVVQLPAGGVERRAGDLHRGLRGGTARQRPLDRAGEGLRARRPGGTRRPGRPDPGTPRPSVADRPAGRLRLPHRHHPALPAG